LSPKNESGRTLVRPLCEIWDLAKSETAGAAPIRGARQVSYFDFFLVFFFLLAMVIYLGV
jgi:hypothetical protein